MRVVCTPSPRTLALRLAAVAIAASALSLAPASPAAAEASFTPPASDFVGTNQVVLQGTKDVGSTVQLRRLGAGVVCTITDESATTWQCPAITVPNGEQTFTGQETLPDDSTEPLTPLVLRVLGAPTLTGSGGDVTTTGRFTGQAEPGASIQLQSSGSGPTQLHSCPAAIGSGFWSCVVILAEGEHQVRARQSLASLGPEYSTYSSATTATIDRTSPLAPVIESPPSGAAVTGPRVVVAGTGEPDARLQVFISGDIACESSVGGSGAWSCTVSLPRPGAWTLQALLRDAAGNFSDASDRVEITASNPPPDAGGGSSPTEPSPAPAPAPAAPEGDGSGPGSTPGSGPTSPGPSNPAPGNPGAAPLPGGGPTSNWGTPTGFGGSLPSPEQIMDRGGWLIAPLVALAYVLLIAVPLRAYATIVGPRLGTSPWRLTGRNRDNARGSDAAPDAASDDPPSSALERPVVSPMLVIVGTFAGAALIAALSGGIVAEVRYLRLVAAIGLGLVLINLLGVVLPARLAGRAVHAATLVRLLPGILAVALVAALVSRFLELQPPVLLGVLVAALAVEPARLRARGGVAIAQIAGVAALSLLAWTAHTLLTPSTGFWMTFAAETTAAIALGGFGSLLLLLLPIGPFPGRELYSISRGGWVAVALVSATVTGAIVASGASFPLLALGLLAAGTAAVLTALSVWVRWVAPALEG